MIVFNNWAEVESVFAEAFDVPPASVDTLPKGQDGAAGLMRSKGSAVARDSATDAQTSAKVVNND